MPKRTNPFQRLIYLIQHQMADGAAVTESKFLTERSTGRSVEVDVVVEGKLSGNPLVVGIECTSSRRRATVEWVDQMIGKHRDLPVDKTILVSKSGFTGEALKKANANGVEALHLREAVAKDWSNVPKIVSGLRFAGFSMRPDEYSCMLDTHTPVQIDPLLLASAVVKEPARETPGTLEQYAIALCRDDYVVEQGSRLWNNIGPDRQKAFSYSVTWTCPEGTTLRLGVAEPLPLKAVKVKIQADVVDRSLNATASQFRDQNVVHAEIADVLTEEGNNTIVVSLLEKDGEFEKGAALVAKAGSQESRIVEMKKFESGSGE